MASAKIVTARIGGLPAIFIGSDPLAQVPSLPEVRAGTLTERPSDKSSDEQRLDNCQVPRERRSAKSRPEGCTHEATKGAQPHMGHGE